MGEDKVSASTTLSSKAAPADMPGFRALSDQVFVRDAAPDAVPRSADDAETVIIYGWGDGLPKHVFKYAEGYRRLFPAAKQVVVLSPIARAMVWGLQRCSDKMKPVVEAAFSQAVAPGGRVLVHIISNTGTVFYAATLSAHAAQWATRMPHRLAVLDSTPSRPSIPLMLSNGARAVALGVSKTLPFPFIVTHMLCAVLLALHFLALCLMGREETWQSCWRVLMDEALVDAQTRRLYLYSKEDDLIPWRDVEEHMAESTRRGWKTQGHVFAGSGHVAHARVFPHEYWAAVDRAWRQAG